jgi:hypothetical protein
MPVGVDGCSPSKAVCSDRVFRSASLHAKHLIEKLKLQQCRSPSIVSTRTRPSNSTYPPGEELLSIKD